MTLWGPSSQGILVLQQNSFKLSVITYKSEITNLCTFMSTQYEFCLGEKLVYPIYFLIEPTKLNKFAWCWRC